MSLATAELESAIEAFEAAWLRAGAEPPLLRSFLPPAGHAAFAEIAVELIRVDMEYCWQNGIRHGVDHYLQQFPEVLDQPQALAAVAFEDYRQRSQAGELIDPTLYRTRYGIEVPVEGEPPALLYATRQKSFADLQRQEPSFASRLLAAERDFPRIGEVAWDFELLEELGRGAFGRVYLARQRGLADRLVALKVTVGPSDESQQLAQLQHTNIVPIYSTHSRGLLQGICMPYLGRSTLATLTTALRSVACEPGNSSEASTLRMAHLDTQKLGPLPTALQLSGIVAPALNMPKIRIDERPYVDFVAWLGARIAEGLVHAHRHGVIHCDLKPANILLSDDGQPVLLDFNVAQSTRPLSSVAMMGGTMPYMSPEQLRSLNTAAPVSPASDVFSLGVILFELLTGRLPFPLSASALDRGVDVSLELRKNTPSPRMWNTAVSPGIAAIVCKCLSESVANRYHDAGALFEDLQRHLSDRPLKYASDSDVCERFAKWRRRHPRLSSAASLVTTGAILACVAGSFWYAREKQYAQQAAISHFEVYQSLLPEARALQLIAEPGSWLDGQRRAAVDRALQHYPAPSGGDWRTQPLVKYLPSNQRASLTASVGQLRAMLNDPPATGNRETLLDHPARAAVDIEEGRFPQAEQKLEAHTRRQPGDDAAWLLLGHCRARRGNLSGAEACYNAAIALRPQLYLGWFYRGIGKYSEQQWQAAGADFTEAIERYEGFASGYFNRALCKQAMTDHAGALADFDLAESYGFGESRLHFARARSLAALQRDAESNDSLARGLEQRPSDAISWTERAMLRVEQDATGAEGDLQAALRLSPHYRTALLNLAHVQAEHLQKREAAIQALTQVLADNPLDFAARAGRGVLLARAQQKDAALADAEALSQGNISAVERFQLACIYALLSRDDAKWKDHAWTQLTRACAISPSLVTVARTDVDLEGLHADARWRWFTQAVIAP